MFATSLALLANEFREQQERAKALAVYGATIGASFAVGPLVGGALTSGFGWRSIFLINIPIGIFALVVTMKHIRESSDPHAPRVDWAGQATLSAGLFLLILGLLRGNDDGWTSTPIVAELAAAAILLIAFVAIERRVSQPMMPLRFFRIPSFAGAQVAAFAISSTFFAVFLYSTLYLQHVLGLSAIEAGLVYLPGTMVMFFVAGATASIAEKVSPRAMIGGGLFLVAAGLLQMSTVGVDSHWTAILPGLVIALVGTGMFNPALSGVALGTLPAEHSGLAAGVNDMFRQAGIAVGVAALGAMISTDALSTGDHAGYVDGLQNALLVSAGIAAIGAFAVALLLRPAGSPAAAPAAA
jgi:predicted MFS family arabinose efflux permease